MVNHPHSSAGDSGLFPDQRTKIPRAMGQLSHVPQLEKPMHRNRRNLHTTTRETLSTTRKTLCSKKKTMILRSNYILECVCVSHSVMSNSLGPMDCSPPGPFVHGILQARILEWVPWVGFSQPRDQTCVSYWYV